MGQTRDYQEWHHRYNDAHSGLSWRLRRVRRHVDEALDRTSGRVRLLSVCSGDGRDVLGVLAKRSDADRVSAVLVELDPGLAQQARADAAAAGLSDVEIRVRDASWVDAYQAAAPADIVLLMGMFGNIADVDVWRLIAFAPQLCRPGATLVWSRGRQFTRVLPGVTAGDLNDEVRARFTAAGFEELEYETHGPGGGPALGVVRYTGRQVQLQLNQPSLFTFLR